MWSSTCSCAQWGENSLDFFRKVNIGGISYKPLIGVGVGKETIAREIDAIGELIGKQSDMSGIDFKNLNKSKGAAVWLGVKLTD